MFTKIATVFVAIALAGSAFFVGTAATDPNSPLHVPGVHDVAPAPVPTCELSVTIGSKAPNFVKALFVSPRRWIVTSVGEGTRNEVFESVRAAVKTLDGMEIDDDTPARIKRAFEAYGLEQIRITEV